jgi:hypothetical protein
MDVMTARVALRERALLDIFDLAVRFCAAHAKAYAKLSLVVLVPAFAASWALAWAGGWWVGWSAAVVLAAFADAPFVALASRLVFSDSVRTREALRMATRALPALFAARLLQALALAASLMMLGVPWLWLGTILLFVGEAIVLERSTLGGALGRSTRLANAHFGTALATMLLLSFPIAAALIADFAGRELLEEVLELKAPAPMLHAGGSWLALIGWWAGVPLVATVRFLVYIDTRTRTEGWDIQTRFVAIATRAEAQKAQRTERGGLAELRGGPRAMPAPWGLRP